MPLDAMRDKIKVMEALIDDQAGTIAVFNYEIDRLKLVVKERDESMHFAEYSLERVLEVLNKVINKEEEEVKESC